MAPHKGQPKPLKAASGNAKRPHPATVASRPVVVPALPLTMITKPPTQANKRASTPSSTNGFPASSLEAALADHTVHADHADVVNGPEDAKALQPAKNTEKAVNGSNVEKPGHTTATVATTNGSHHITGNESDVPAPANGANGINGLNGTTGTGLSFPAADGSRAVESASTSVNEASQGNPHINTPSASEFRLLKLIRAPDAAQCVPQPQSATSPTRPDLQLPFHHPVTHPLQHQLSTDQHPNPANLNGPPRMNHIQHHPRMSNGGGVIFGGFSGSHTPSPAPPPAGFYPPPPPLPNGENGVHPQTNGHPHGQSNGNNLPGPIDTRFRPDMLPSSIDTFGQVPAPVPQPFDPFSPTAGPYGLSTPHSFHDSHTSGEPNGVENGTVNGAIPPYLNNGIPYGGHAHHEHPGVPPFMPLQPFPRPPGSFDDGLGEHIRYFQDQFDSGELTDCTLELVSTKLLHHPVKIIGHKFIFARSPALKQHIMAARATDLGSHTITIESDDAYLRSDAWWSAVRHLYLHPLVNPGMMDSPVSGLHFDGDKIDRFKFCLGYAAAGHLLTMHDVFMRGLFMAADFITWDTVEEALGFVFEGTSQRHVNYDNEQNFDLDFVYGPEVRLLLEAAMVFLINEFPPNFELDASVADPLKFARIPVAVAAIMPPPPPPAEAAPTVARGSNMRKPNRLSNIKFGDLPAAFPEEGALPHRGPAKCSPVLSRILLNLPFEELRAVMTSESNGVSGWNTAQDRYHAVADVVAQREARRLRAVDVVRAGAVPHYREIQQRLSAQRRHAIVEPWDALNWQEQVVQPRGGEIPQLVRTWVPHFSVGLETSQQPLQPQHRIVHDSMV
ncbi:hypothetical protein F4820DRAFT_282405 [Hypoxylon rubiginosum]|uniref:Uncharacterized protein n=1 Tax=Hypoxylon rubiginosum TaxID=110542 RepID=A0ACB9Z325_9PEZI|nr:hypothetical protein F4820DRAFT_282405 [Hypoxylon rubiginosum]